MTPKHSVYNSCVLVGVITLGLVGCDAGNSNRRLGDAGPLEQGGQASVGGSSGVGGQSDSTGGASVSDNVGGQSAVGDTGGSSSVASTGGTTSLPPATGGASPAGGAPATGGAQATGGTPAACAGVAVPTTTAGVGMVVASNGYVTSYYSTATGFAYTWVGTGSIVPATCIVPSCTTAGCSPSFGANAICAAGKVAGDSTYSSVVGFGFNLMQANTSTDAPTMVSAPSYMTFYYTKSGTGQLRLQISNGTKSWCFDTLGVNYSGFSIPISEFNTACWDNSGTYLTSGTSIQSVELIIPSGLSAVTFSDCLLDVKLG